MVIFVIVIVDGAGVNVSSKISASTIHVKTTGHVIQKMIPSAAIANPTFMANDVLSTIFVPRENCAEMAPTVIYWMARFAR